MKNDQRCVLFEGRFSGSGAHVLPLRKRIRTALLLFFLILTCTSALPGSLSIIELNYRRADELVPVIEPLLDPGERITGKGYELYLVARPETERRVRELIARLDNRPEQLLISVRTPQDTLGDESGISAQGSITRDRVRIGAGARTQDDRITIQAEDNTSFRTRRQSPQVRATEGEPALIQTGVSVPVRSVDRRSVNGRPVERERVEYRPVTAGFYVTAYLNGDNVRLEIRQRDDSLQAGGAISTRGLTTSAQGRLGEWIPLGGINTEENRTDSGILNRQTTHTRRNNAVMVKVEKISADN